MKTQFEIGEIFNFGLVKLKAVESCDCEGCFFEYLEKCTDVNEFYVGQCDPDYRKENTGGIKFIEVKE